jgi:hypothetical protein
VVVAEKHRCGTVIVAFGTRPFSAASKAPSWGCNEPRPIGAAKKERYMKALFGAAAVAALLVATPSFAQSFGPSTYINLGYTNFSLDEVGDEDLGDDVDFNLGTVTGRVGTRFSNYFGVEGELGIGVQDQEESDGVNRLTTKLKYEAAAFAVGFLPVGPSTDLFARAGVGITELEFEFDGPGTGFDESGSEGIFGLGVGVQHFFDGVNGIRGDYTRYSGEDESAEFDAVSVSYVRRF